MSTEPTSHPDLPVSSEGVLLPCPFCGAPAKKIDGKDLFENYVVGFGCSVCPAEMIEHADAYPYSAAGEDAGHLADFRLAWNARAGTADGLMRDALNDLLTRPTDPAARIRARAAISQATRSEPST